MKKTTTLLTAAGLLFLAGCKTEVMKDREYTGNPQEDPTSAQVAPMAPTEKAPVTPVDTPAPAPAPKGFKPMEGSYANEGIEDDSLRGKRAKGKKAAPAAKPAPKGGVYVVKPGDTLGRIAARYGVSVNALRAANNRTAAQDKFLRPGTKLVIPAAGAKGAVKGRAKAAPGCKLAGKLNADGTYTMVKGDNIPKVARKFGIRAKALQAANNLTDEETTRLQIGHKLIIPTGAAAKAGARKAVNKKSAPAPKKPAAPKPETPAADDAAVAMPPAPAPAPAADDAVATPPAPAPAADDTAAVLPPAAPVENAAAAETQFVSVAGYKDLAEFASKNNTTIDELCKLNPRLDPNAPLAANDMLYVPKK